MDKFIKNVYAVNNSELFKQKKINTLFHKRVQSPAPAHPFSSGFKPNI